MKAGRDFRKRMMVRKSAERVLVRATEFASSAGAQTPAFPAPMAGACPPSLSTAVANAGLGERAAPSRCPQRRFLPGTYVCIEHRQISFADFSRRCHRALDHESGSSVARVACISSRARDESPRAGSFGQDYSENLAALQRGSHTRVRCIKTVDSEAAAAMQKLERSLEHAPLGCRAIAG